MVGPPSSARRLPPSLTPLRSTCPLSWLHLFLCFYLYILTTPLSHTQGVFQQLTCLASGAWAPVHNYQSPVIALVRQVGAIGLEGLRPRNTTPTLRHFASNTMFLLFRRSGDMDGTSHPHSGSQEVCAFAVLVVYLQFDGTITPLLLS